MPSAILSVCRRISSLLVVVLSASASPAASALSAEIVARVDSTIITERDVEVRQTLYLHLLGLQRSARVRALSRDFFVEMAIEVALKRAYLDERKVRPSGQAVALRRQALRPYAAAQSLGKAQALLQAENVLYIRWETLLLSLTQRSATSLQSDVEREQARRQSFLARLPAAHEGNERYVVEEVFLEASAPAARASAYALAEEIVRSLARGNVFTRVATVFPGSYEFRSLPFSYKSELPPSLQRVLAEGGLRPVESVGGIHLYRVRPFTTQRSAIRYSFVQTAFARSANLAQQVNAYRNHLDTCFDPSRVALELAARDTRLIEKVPEEDLSPDTKRVLDSLQLGESAGPFPVSESLVVFLTLCARNESDQVRDSHQSIVRVLQARRVDEFGTQLLSRLRLAADVSRSASKSP